MDLTKEQFMRLSKGVISIETRENGFVPLRFTARQLEELKSNDRFLIRSRASAGITFSCETDARILEAEFDLFPGSARDIYGFDLYIDNHLYAHNEGSIAESTKCYLCYSLPFGNKKIDLYFPYLVGTCIHRFSLIDSTYAKPCQERKRIFTFGDSITQGYTVHFPSLCYVGAIARELDMDLTNFAVGGDTFHPDLLDPDLTGKADLILIAYGTNDWTSKNATNATDDAARFFEKVIDIAANAPVICITPIWRADCLKEVPSGLSFDGYRSTLISLAKKYPTVHIIPGESIFPTIPELFADKKIHPDDNGSAILSNRLIEEILKII